MPISSGFSLIEILISFFILSLVLLGLDAVTITALREAKTAYFFSVATQQLNNLVERLTLIKNDKVTDVLANWNVENQQALPHGRGTIITHYPIYQLNIFWGDNKSMICNKNTIGNSGCLKLIIPQQS
ncbi:MAG: hypothetical protein A3F11_02465 [Gammaproteobacteria bacterium RIFCSPHIGHO2_12_FULL_37_14]|nr:MAG: hypothetical protein A3F11_02465 [Gammaproteobacteria bacterium RIFCSPHIGHO2_12_FULL_37_14]